MVIMNFSSSSDKNVENYFIFCLSNLKYFDSSENINKILKKVKY